MENISLNRINKLREACADAEIDAFFVRETSNAQWLSAFDGVFDEEGAHAMLVTPDGATLHTDSRYSEACKKAAGIHGGVVEVNDANRARSVSRTRSRFRASVRLSALLPNRFPMCSCARRRTSSWVFEV